jgi:hypothetical protein
VTAEEVYELTTQGGSTDFQRVVGLCRDVGPFCLIGGLAVNCYVEPVYTLDADFVIVAAHAEELQNKLRAAGFILRQFAHSLNAQPPQSQLRVQFTSDPRYQDFPARAEERAVLGTRVPVATLADIVQGKIWSYSDPDRRLSKRKKDELDLLRLAEAHPEVRVRLPRELKSQLDNG